MTTHVGLWIDHKKAVLVFLAGKAARIERIEARIEKPSQPPGGARSKTPYSPWDKRAEDIHERKLANQFARYYTEVSARLKEADDILLLGPGTAKLEFQHQLKSPCLRNRIVHIETTDKMTQRQIAARVRQFFAAVAPAAKRPPR